MGRPFLPLQGLTVVAIEQAVAAPFCSSRLADAGARVIKIERPEGDFARFYDTVAHGQSSYFVWLNRGKESVVMDLADHRERARLTDLLRDADILLQNLKPGALARLGFDDARLESLNERLITCSISGYGENGGPLADRKAYDLLIQAESGLASITGGAEQAARVGISVVDIATGATAYGAILEAVIERSRTGRGRRIQVSMFDVMAEWLTVPLLHQEAGAPPQRVGLAHPSIAPYGMFVTGDGRQVLIAVQSEREWGKFARQVLQDADAVEDPRFHTNVARVANRAAVDGLVAAAFGAISAAQAEQRLLAADIAFAVVNDMAALSTHPHLRRITVATSAGDITYPAPAPIATGSERTYGPVPDLGEHRAIATIGDGGTP